MLDDNAKQSLGLLEDVMFGDLEIQSFTASGRNVFKRLLVDDDAFEGALVLVYRSILVLFDDRLETSRVFILNEPVDDIQPKMCSLNLIDSNLTVDDRVIGMVDVTDTDGALLWWRFIDKAAEAASMDCDMEMVMRHHLGGMEALEARLASFEREPETVRSGPVAHGLSEADDDRRCST